MALPRASASAQATPSDHFCVAACAARTYGFCSLNAAVRAACEESPTQMV
jgi:hypothetical protein